MGVLNDACVLDTSHMNLDMVFWLFLTVSTMALGIILLDPFFFPISVISGVNLGISIGAKE